MSVTSADPSIARVTDGAAGIWEISAIAPGTTSIEARIPGTDHAATTSIEVVSPPEPPLPIDGRFEPGAITDYLAPVLNALPATRLSTTEPDTSRTVSSYPLLLPQCGDIAALSNFDWLEAEELHTTANARLDMFGVWVTPVESGGALIYVHTFADSASAETWTGTFRAAINERVGGECELITGFGPATFAPEVDISSSEFDVSFSPSELGSTPGLSVTAAQNVVIVVVAAPDDLATVRSALTTALSLPTV